MNSVTTPSDFGAVGNGVADDTAAVQAAIDFAIANNLELQLRAATYRCTAVLNVVLGNNKTFSMTGVRSSQGFDLSHGTVFLFDGAAGGIYVSTPNGSTLASLAARGQFIFKQFQILGTGADKTWGLKIGNNASQIDTFSAYNIVEDVTVVGAFINCCEAFNTRQLHIYRSIFYNTAASAGARAFALTNTAAFPTYVTGDVQITDSTFFTQSGVNSRTVMYDAQAGYITGIHMTDCIIYEGVYGVYITGAANTLIFDIWFTNVVCDGPVYATSNKGFYLNSTTATSEVNNIYFRDCYSVSYKGIGMEFLVNTPGQVKNINVEGCYFGTLGDSGLKINNVNAFVVHGCKFYQNNLTAAGAAAQLTGACLGFDISGNVVSANTSAYLVSLSGSAPNAINYGSVLQNSGDTTTGAINNIGNVGANVFGVTAAPNTNISF